MSNCLAYKVYDIEQKMSSCTRICCLMGALLENKVWIQGFLWCWLWWMICSCMNDVSSWDDTWLQRALTPTSWTDERITWCARVTAEVPGFSGANCWDAGAPGSSGLGLEVEFAQTAVQESLCSYLKSWHTKILLTDDWHRYIKNIRIVIIITNYII